MKWNAGRNFKINKAVATNSFYSILHNSSSVVNKHWNRPQLRGQSHSSTCEGRMSMCHISIEKRSTFIARWKRSLAILCSQCAASFTSPRLCVPACGVYTIQSFWSASWESLNFFISFLRRQAELAKHPRLACMQTARADEIRPTDGRCSFTRHHSMSSAHIQRERESQKQGQQITRPHTRI
jgi:hypothetical protein